MSAQLSAVDTERSSRTEPTVTVRGLSWPVSHLCTLRVDCSKAKTNTDHAELASDEEFVNKMKTRDPSKNVGIGDNKY